MKKILLVDDKWHLVQALKLQLEAEYEILCAYDGIQALEKAKAEKPDLMILDLMLPKMDGYKVCGLLKKDARYANIPIIMFTAKTQEEEDRRIIKEVGADGYVMKPCDSQVLLDKIKELIEK